MSADELKAKFATKAVPDAGGLLLLHPEDAIALVRQAANLRITILGIDGLLISHGETVSPIEHSVDFSSTADQAAGAGPRLSASSISAASMVSYSR